MSELNSIDDELDLDDEDLTLFTQVSLGAEVQDFIRTDLGRYVMGAMRQEIEDCAFKILETPVWRKRKIQDLQMKAKAAKYVLATINEAMVAGELAHHSLITRNIE